MIANDINKLKVQHEIVEKQLLQLILENQAACDDELDKYIIFIIHINYLYYNNLYFCLLQNWNVTK